MTAEIYLFGNLGDGYTQYIDDSTKSKFRTFGDKTSANSQLIVHRDEKILYYTYVRKLHYTGSSDRYIGIAYVINDQLIKDIDGLFSIFEKAITHIASNGKILNYADDGTIVPKVEKLYLAKSEFADMSSYLKSVFDNFVVGKIEKMPALDFSISTTESKSFKYTDSKVEIINALSLYPTVYIFKDDDYEDPESKSYASILSRKNKEIGDLKKENDKILRQKKRTTIVTLLCLVLAVSVLVIFAYKNSSDQKTERIDGLERYVKNLKKDSINLKENLVQTSSVLLQANTNLAARDKQVQQLQDDTTRLKGEIKVLNDKIANLRSQIDSKERITRDKETTIERLNRTIRDKDQTISELQNKIRQISNKNTSSSASEQIQITGICFRTIDNQGKNIDKGFNNVRLTASHYIEVMIQYYCTFSGTKKARLILSGPAFYRLLDDDVYFINGNSSHTFEKLLGNGRKMRKGDYSLEVYIDGVVVKEQRFTLK